MKAKGIVNVFAVALLSAALVACSSDDDDDAPLMDVFVEGNYSVNAPATTEFDTDGGTCGDAVGTLTLSGGVLSGSVDTASQRFDVNGEVGTDGVVMGGGFSIGSQIAADFDGQFEGEAGGGTWQSSAGCEGTWDASLVVE